MLPMGTPAAAIAFSAGYYRPLHAVRAGVVLSLASLACMLALLVAWWPLVGLR
jgi:sodium-dependent dicarboxylate transporter 2/3/5